MLTRAFPGCFGLLLSLVLPPALGAQVLARPGWAGSGVAPEVWWARAVFYRIDPSRFQDSDGDGKGDLPGIVERLDYLQSLGVDALVLDGTLSSSDNDALGDLVREASRRQLRVLLTADPTASQGDLVRTVRNWLGAGIAGIWLPKPPAGGNTESYAALITAVRSAVQSFPGDRVLLTDPAPVSLGPESRPARASRRIDPNSFHAARGGLLVTSALFPVSEPQAGALRSSLASAGEESSSSNGLLRFSVPPVTKSQDAAAYAILLFGSRGAILLDFGEEIGLNTAQHGANGDGAVMQWTPSNQTPAPAQQGDSATKAPAEPQFGAYHPYVPPPRSITSVPSAPLKVTPDLNIPQALPAPDTLPGFTSGTLPVPPQDGADLNVTTQDRDPHSLLNAYRQLIALHHGNATLRNGTQYILNRDSQQTLVWVRRAPANSRIAANVICAENLSENSVALNLDADLEAQGMRPGALRPLFDFPRTVMTGESTPHLVLPAHGVFVGEIYHGGEYVEAAPRARHSARHSHRRVRR